MKFAIDRIVENIAVLENVKTQEIVEIDIKQLPKGIHEGSVIVLNDGIYEVDINEEKLRRNSFRERLNRLKGLKK